jgi:predicted nucleic acid-binding Zn ribbon protein
MPVYVYRRRDGSSFELEQRITADALASCPTTGQRVERVMQPFSPRYKGAGFYSTDHVKAEPGAGSTDRGSAQGDRERAESGVQGVKPEATGAGRGAVSREVRTTGTSSLAHRGSRRQVDGGKS